MPDNIDWKQKYRTAVQETEFEERRWRRLEQALRRLVNRLCAAGMGAAAQIDEPLATIAAANRRDADAEELEGLAAALGEAIAAADRAAAADPVGAPDPAAAADRAATAAWSRTRSAAAALLSHIAGAFADDPAVASLGVDLAAAETDEALATILLRAADCVAKRADALAQERSQATAILAQVGHRLEELAAYFDAAGDATRSSLEATQTLNADVMARVRELSQGTRAATDLRALRALVDAGLQSVNQCVSEFRDREEVRLSEQSARADRMRSRIVELENETRELQHKLAFERRAARIDALTGVANRMAFDERLAEAIDEVRRTGRPAVLLIWDIDHFKSINDRYGHRAGDLVLKTVADCFASAVRATDFLARIGGEEFAVLLSSLGAQAAAPVAEQLRAAVAGLRFHFRGTPVPVTASCGFAEIGSADTTEHAYERADAALYRAKSGGRNRCEAG